MKAFKIFLETILKHATAIVNKTLYVQLTIQLLEKSQNLFQFTISFKLNDNFKDILFPFLADRWVISILESLGSLLSITQ